ncbi:MAG: protein-glutamine glutaminase family protein [Myxococcota bacterium]|nr:hypothetical protein [Spirochaeta sp.]RPG04207.1 MAG: hypothetical protein CBC32_014725 [Proteobacteria bacterium TMED72]
MKSLITTIFLIVGGGLCATSLAQAVVHQSVPMLHGGTRETAEDAFDQIDDSTETGYVDGANYGDGCYARALVACQKLEKWIADEGHEGCSILTAFAHDSDGPGGACTLTGPGGVQWGYHQICVLRCEDEEGQWEDWYLDPAFEEGPVSQQDWLGNFCSGTPDMVTRPGPRSGPSDSSSTVTSNEIKGARKVIESRNP